MSVLESPYSPHQTSPAKTHGGKIQQNSGRSEIRPPGTTTQEARPEVLVLRERQGKFAEVGMRERTYMLGVFFCVCVYVFFYFRSC